MTAKHPDAIGTMIPWWIVATVVILIIIALAALSGCATAPDLRAHEERHCDGWTHQAPENDQVVLRYEWVKTHPASAKPWAYLYVADTHAACAALGAQTARARRIEACATWKPQGCTIILPKD